MWKDIIGKDFSYTDFIVSALRTGQHELNVKTLLIYTGRAFLSGFVPPCQKETLL
jgi:hypothetical protein